jgi:hypothetical protein
MIIIMLIEERKKCCFCLPTSRRLPILSSTAKWLGIPLSAVPIPKGRRRHGGDGWKRHCFLSGSSFPLSFLCLQFLQFIASRFSNFSYRCFGQIVVSLNFLPLPSLLEHISIDITFITSAIHQFILKCILLVCYDISLNSCWVFSVTFMC